MYEHIHLKPAADAAHVALLQGQGYRILRRSANALGLLESAPAVDPVLAKAWERATADNFVKIGSKPGIRTNLTPK